MRRQLIARYEHLADRVLALEHKCKGANIPVAAEAAQVSAAPTTYPSYPGGYTNYQLPSAPPMNYQPSQPFNPYTNQSYSV